MMMRVLSSTQPMRPRSTHPPVGPFRCGRMGSRIDATRNEEHQSTREERKKKVPLAFEWAGPIEGPRE